MTTDETKAEERMRDERAVEEADMGEFQSLQEQEIATGDVEEPMTVEASAADGDATRAPAETADGALLPQDQSERFSSRWEEIQASFVDRPQEAVEEADSLVADLMQRVTGNLTQERERLESQWARGSEVSTEDLRVALTRYRAFFERLLST